MRALAWAAMGLSALAVVWGLPVLPAAAETVLCTTVTPPDTIGSPGVYCLKHNAVVSITTGPAILINANNVVLDLNGWILRNSVAAGTDASASAGIAIGAGRRRVTIRNGTILGFGNGVSVVSPPGAGLTGDVIEDLRVVDSISVGINLPFGQGDVIQRNLILNTGDTASPTTTNMFGISAGVLATIQNNDIVTVNPTGNGIAGGLSVGPRSAVINNRIKDVNGISGINCSGGSDAAGLRDNIVEGVFTASAYTGCSLLSNNF